MRWGLLTCVLLLAACAAPPVIVPEPSGPPVLVQNFAPGKPSVRAETKAAAVGDVLHGNYETWWPNGNRAAVGNYFNGRRDGQWRQWYENGNPECEARFEDELLVGAWRSWYPNGQVQEQGEYRNGKKSGNWELFDEAGVLESRSTYYGGQLVSIEYGTAILTKRFTNIDGFPTVRMAVRRDADGNFSREGEFHAWYAKGADAAIGQYRSDHRVGTWRQWHETGKKSLESNYDEQGRLHGAWSMWLPTGILSEEGSFEHGAREGRWFRRTDEGVKITSYYVKDVLHGPYFERDLDDEILVVGRYEFGAPVGDWIQASGLGLTIVPYGSGNVDERYPNGSVKARGERSGEMRVGQWTFYYENGQLALDGYFDEGKLSGRARSMRSDGAKWREATYEMGVRTGPATEWDEDGLSYLQGSWDSDKAEGAWELCDWMGNHLKNYQRAKGKWSGEEATPAQINEYVTRYESGGIETRWHGFELQGKRCMHGEFKRYYPDGKLKARGQYTNNVATGEWTYYHTNEKPFARGNYKAGDRVGVWSFFHNNGGLARRGRFGQDWEKPLELPSSERVSFEKETWDLELDWRGFEPSFPEKREAWIYYNQTGEVAERKYFTPRHR